MIRRMPVIAAIAAVLLTIAFWFLLYQPLDAEESRYRDETEQLVSEQQELTNRIAALRDVQVNTKDYKSKLARLANYVPDDPAQPEALVELQRMADETGVEITQIAFADPELLPGGPETSDPDTVLARIPTQMTVSGAYFQVVDLLRRIEVDMERAIKVDAVTMAEDEELAFPDLTVTWSGHVFAVLPIDDTAGTELLVQASESPSEGDDSESASEAPSDGSSEDGDAPDSGDAAPADSSQAGTS